MTYSLHCTNGVETGIDLVVGADGAWSRVRPLLSDEKPFYAGVTGLDVTISDAEKQRPVQAKRVGGGICLTIGENKGILAQKTGSGSIRVYAFMRLPEFWRKECDINWADSEPAKKTIMAGPFGDWDHGSKDMIL